MKRILFIISILTLFQLSNALSAQQSLRQYTYFSYDYDSDHTDTTKVFVDQLGDQLNIYNPYNNDNTIPGYVDERTFVDLLSDSIYYLYEYPDSTYCVASIMKRNDIKWDTQKIDSKNEVLNDHIHLKYFSMF